MDNAATDGVIGMAAPHSDMTASLESFVQDAERVELFRELEARFASTKACAGDKHAARRAVDALADSDKPLPLPATTADNKGWVLMDDPFLPCTTGLENLLPVTLKDLVMGSHHRGKFLLVELINVIRIGDLETVLGVRDCAGEVERLKINTACIKLHKNYRWPQSGHWFVIKEPFLTQDEMKESKSPCIRIDHPSNLEDAHRLPDNLIQREPLNRVLTAVGKRTAQLCKESGNSAFIRGDLVGSHDSYAEALHIITNSPEQQDDTIKRDLQRKRAYLRLKIGRYEGAIADTLASLSDDPDTMSDRLNARAYFCAASACYSLKHFDRAHELLQKQLRLTPKATNGRELLKKINTRIREQRHGHYDVDAIKSVFVTQPRIDAADYDVNTVTKASGPGRGRGLYATKDLAPGDLILAETAFACTWADEEACIVANKWSVRHPNEFPSLFVGLWTSLVQKISNNPVDGQRFLDLHGAYNSTDSASNIVIEVDDTPVVDTYQVHDIMIRNVFQLVPAGPSDPAEKGNSGIFVRTSYINHSCLLNSNRLMIGDFVMIHATKPIAKGEEITTCYDGAKVTLLPFKKRMHEMQMDWHFQCTCPLCLAERRCPSLELAKRDELAEAAQSILREQSSIPNLKQRMERLAREIAATYDNELYPDLPLMATIPVHVYLVMHCKTPAGDRSKSAKCVVELLRACGYRVDVHNNQIWHVAPTANSFAWGEIDIVREPLLHQAIRAFLTGNIETANHLFAFAVSLERICLGGNAETMKMSGK